MSYVLLATAVKENILTHPYTHRPYRSLHIAAKARTSLKIRQSMNRQQIYLESFLPTDFFELNCDLKSDIE